MARARNIKPGFFENEILADLEPHARLLFIGLWLLCDRDGRMEYRPKRIGAKLFPYEPLNIAELHGKLCTAGFITIYTVEGKDYLQVNEFVKHQAPHPKEKAGECPPPPQTTDDAGPVNSPEKPGNYTASSGKDGTSPSDSLNPDSLNPDSNTTAPSSADADSTPEDCSSELVEPESPPACWLPAISGSDVPVTEAQIAEWSEAYPAIDVLSEVRKAKVWLDANPKNRKTKSGMARFVVNWLSRAQDKAPRSGAGNHGPRSDPRIGTPDEPGISPGERSRRLIAIQREQRGAESFG